MQMINDEISAEQSIINVANTKVINYGIGHQKNEVTVQLVH